MRLTAHPLLGLLLTLSACGVEPGPNEPAATRTHALLRVERSSEADGQPAPTGVAFAAVVRLPELADPEPLLRSGKTLNLPAPGQCALLNHERDATPANDLARAEFLDAGDVMVGTNDAPTLLAPHPMTLEVLGKVYTSRDREAEPLPSGAPYVLKTTGSDQLPSLELRVQAPEDLRLVAVAGADLSTLSSLSGLNEVPLTWQAGDARDVVYVEVAGAPEVGSLGVCAFHDADGHGSLPRGLFGASGDGSLSFHRLREVAADVPALDGAEVRFDFALTAQVSFH